MGDPSRYEGGCVEGEGVVLFGLEGAGTGVKGIESRLRDRSSIDP